MHYIPIKPRGPIKNADLMLLKAESLTPGAECGKLKSKSSMINAKRRMPEVKSVKSSNKVPVFILWFATGCLFFLSSCNTLKNTNYFQGIKNDTTLNHLVSKNFEPKIQKGDLLAVNVSSLSPENTVLYNAPQNAEGPVTGFLVDSAGNISFFKLGDIHVEGMTRGELKDQLQKDLVPYLAQTVVSVGFLNRHVTLMGGGISSQVLPIPNDNMTLLDALAMAGDIGEKGKKDEVMVIRENGNSRIFKKLDLTNESVFYSPYFYLQPNDIIYVKPTKEKEKFKAAQIISYVTTAISLYILIFTRFIK
jgi:polysaccharide export outer membrane protein